MLALENPRHELFAQAVASGKSASEAYRQSGAKGKNADVQAAKLVVKSSIRERVEELKEAQSKKCEMTRDQLRQFLVSIILAKPEEADDPAYCDAEPQLLKEETVRYFSDKPGFSNGQKSWYQKARDQFGLFTLREFPTVLEECFQTPIEGAIYAEMIDRLRVQGALQRAEVDNSALVHTAWDLGSPLNTVCWFFQIVGPEIRIIDCDSDLDLTPVQRVARMLAKGYFYGSHFLPHDAQVTQKSGKTFLTELNELGLRNCKAVPQTYDIWIGINRLRQLLPRFTFRIPACERGLEALCNYHSVRTTSTGLAVDEPVHSWASHAADALRTLAEAEMVGMLHSAGSTANVQRMHHVTVKTGFRGNVRAGPPDFLDQFFSNPRPKPRVLR